MNIVHILIDANVEDGPSHGPTKIPAESFSAGFIIANAATLRKLAGV